MSAYLKRYPEVCGRIAAVGSHDQSGGGRRRSRGPDRPSRRFHAWSRAMSARCGGSWSPRTAISSSAASRRRRRRSPSHDTIQFGASTAPPDWRFVEGGREVRVTHTPRFVTNSADAAIQYAEQGGGLTRVLAYQAAEAIKAGRLKIVLAKFEQPALPIHIVYPTSRLLSAKVRDLHRSRRPRSATGISADTDAALVRSRLSLRHHAERAVGARDHDVVGLDQALREADRAAGLDHVGLDREPLPDLRRADEIDRKPDRHQRRCRRPFRAPQLWPIALSASAAISPPWIRPRALVCGLASRRPMMTASVGSLGIERLPGIGERALPEMRSKPSGISVAVMLRSRAWRMVPPLNAIATRNAPPTKFKTKFRRLFKTSGADPLIRAGRRSSPTATSSRPSS